MRVDPSYITNLVGSLDQAQSNEQQLSSELSSGTSITSLSKDPVGAGQNVLLLNQIQQDDSFTQSSNQVTGQLQVADSALGSVVSELTQAVTLATSANNGTMNASDVKSIGNQISGILDEVQSLANTSYQGQYVFAGGQTSAAPFSTSAASSPGDCRMGRRSSSMFPEVKFFWAAARTAFLARSTRWWPIILPAR
jgi:flagellar hook-associated protein 3 FlgL